MRRRIMIVVLVILAIPALIAVGELAGRFSGGRLGLLPIKGESMDPMHPHGCDVLVVPWGVGEGRVVVAYGSLENPEIAMDTEPTLMVKMYMGDRLESLNFNDFSTHFKVRGLVVASIPVQKIFFWRNDSPSRADPRAHETTMDERLAIHTERIAVSIVESEQEAEVRDSCVRAIYELSKPAGSWQKQLKGGEVVCWIRVKARPFLTIVRNGQKGKWIFDS